MSPSRRPLAIQLGLVIDLTLAFLAAELFRYADPVRATRLSMLGWATFALLCLVWVFERRGVRGGLRLLARVGSLTAVALPVLWAYYAHSGVLAAGIEVDASYTFLGLHGFVGVRNPITFAGRTPSYAQFPLALLTHLPADLVGFDRLGPFAVHAGIMLQLAALLAVLIVVLVDRRIVVQAALVALAAACFSNRLTLLLYNLTGYAIPAVIVGVFFLVAALGDRRPTVAFPRAGMLLSVALLHHYPGVFFVVPIVAAWVVAGRAPWSRIATFARVNAPLCAVLVIAAICMGIHPDLLATRVRAVSAPDMTLDAIRAKAALNWRFLSGEFLPISVDVFFRQTAGSWHLLDMPPLGGPLPFLVVGSWIGTILALGRRGLEFAGRLALLMLALVALTAAQHLVTGFENYRDMMLVVGLVTTSIGFVPLIARVPRRRGAALLAWALVVAASNWVDVATLAGRRYGVPEYAPKAQALAESLRRRWRRDDAALRGSVVVTIVRQPFPLGRLYQVAAREHGVDLRFDDGGSFCGAPIKTVAATLSADCRSVAFVLSAEACPPGRERLGWPAPPDAGVPTLYKFAPACGPGPPRPFWAARAISLDD